MEEGQLELRGLRDAQAGLESGAILEFQWKERDSWKALRAQPVVLCVAIPVPDTQPSLKSVQGLAPKTGALLLVGLLHERRS